MNVSSRTSPSASLALWEPTSTPLPAPWVQVMEQLIQQTRGKPHPYIMDTGYDALRVGDRLRSWGLPWEVVMAGYLWECNRGEIQEYQLANTEKVFQHILHATTYLEYIRDDNLPPLLTPPYDDLGGLLIAVAIYYETFRTLQELSNNQPLLRKLRSDVERVERTLISVAKRLGMWHFKREVEDITEQLCRPVEFLKMKKEYDQILERDRALLEDMRHWLMNAYREATRNDQIAIMYIPCGVVGLKRREQDANITQKTEKKPLNGFDLSMFEVIVPKVADCYTTLGIFSQLGLIKQSEDQIAAPKTNGYSHIYLVINPKEAYAHDTRYSGSLIYPCKLQIATPIMQAVTWYGPLYPDYYRIYTKSAVTDLSAIPSLDSLWQSEQGKVFATLSKNMTASRPPLDSKAPIVVYQSKSRVPVSLPKGATALDFAFKLDQLIGSHAVYAIVNNRQSPLYRVLDADDTVEIITSTEIQAQELWLQPGHATIPAVRKQIKKSLRDRRGYRLLSQELERYHCILPPEVLEEQLATLVKQHSLGTIRAYLERLDSAKELIYTPKWAAQEIMQRLAQQNELLALHTSRNAWVPVIDTQFAKNGHAYHQQRFCGFCQPSYPYDIKIIGRIRKRDHTLVVHKESCPHLLERAGNPASPLLPMIWQLQPPMFRVAFYLAAQDRRGLILDLTRQLRRYHCDLVSLNAEAITKFGEARVRLTIEAHSYAEALDIWRALYRIDNVTKVELDVSATSLQVHDRLQQLWQKEEAFPGASLAEFLDEPVTQEPRSVILSNPYDISRPPAPHMFFGRSTEIERMRRELCDTEQGRALLLYGPRRSGKTSICANFLERQVRPPYWGVFFSLFSFVERSEEFILEKIAEAVGEQFYRQLHRSAPSWADFHDSGPQVRLRHFLEYCLDQVPQSRLILILDEFGAAFASSDRHILQQSFFTFWKDLLRALPQLSLVFILPTSAHNQLASENFANVFSYAGTLPLEFLDAASARQLLIDPLCEQNVQIFSTTALLAMRQTGGNPYYMTLIGRELINYLNRETNQQLITDRDLRVIIDQLIRPGTHQYYDYVRLELQDEVEFRIIQGLVEITARTGESKVQLKKLANWLEISPSNARPSLDRLYDGLILNMIGPPANPYYSFKIEMIRKWLARNRWFFADEYRHKSQYERR
jgi:(p)ppGpp synthase/HD superfamily hydrolase